MAIHPNVRRPGCGRLLVRQPEVERSAPIGRMVPTDSGGRHSLRDGHVSGTWATPTDRGLKLAGPAFMLPPTRMSACVASEPGLGDEVSRHSHCHSGFQWQRAKVSAVPLRHDVPNGRSL